MRVWWFVGQVNVAAIVLIHVAMTFNQKAKKQDEQSNEWKAWINLVDKE